MDLYLKNNNKMRAIQKSLMLSAVLCTTISCSMQDYLEDAHDYVSYVDPYIGSAGHGHVFVGANVPFGA